MKHIEVVAALIIRGDKVFCAQRKDEGENARKWEFPGGKIEAGESAEEALEREIGEEFATRIACGKHILSVEHQYSDFSLKLHGYLAIVVEGQLECREHLDSRWAMRTELDSIDWAPADIALVQAVKNLL